MYAWPLSKAPVLVEKLSVKLHVDALWRRGDQALLKALRAWIPPKREERTPAKLLDPTYEVVKFEGREGALARLGEFVEGAHRTDVLVIVGPGGTGKTRLMVEWCKRMRERGWLAGFLDHREGTDMSKIVGGPSACFLVSDYASSEPQAVDALLRAMRRRGAGASTMRVVLLARHEGPWLRMLREDHEVLARHEVVELGDLYPSAKDQKKGFEAARRGLADCTASIASSDVEGVFKGRDELNARALYVHMRALLSVVLGEESESLSPKKVLEHVLKHELNAWWRWLSEHNSFKTNNSGLRKSIKNIACALVLCGDVDIDEEFYPLVDVVVPKLDPARRTAFIECFTELYQRPGTNLVAPLEPDLLGEELVASVLEGVGEGVRERWFSLAWHESAPSTAVARTLSVLTRLASRKRSPHLVDEFLQEYGTNIVQLILQVANQRIPHEGAGAVRELRLGAILAEAVRYASGCVASDLAEAIPERNVELREVGAAAWEICVETARSEGDRAGLARCLNNFGNSLAGLGRRKEAMVATKESVKIGQELVPTQPAFALDLAVSLNNLGRRLSESGQREEAMATTMAVVELYRELAQLRPDDFRPDLAASLNNLGVMLSELGRREEAMASTKEAVDLMWELARVWPSVFIPHLADFLMNLGVRWRELGQPAKAMAATEEAVDLYRVLAGVEPDAFTPYLAKSLGNLGMMLSVAELREEALAATEESVGLLRKLGRERPSIFKPDLAMALNNLGIILGALRRGEQVMAATKESVDLYRELAAGEPSAFTPHLAMSLSNFGNRLAELGRRDEAMAAAQEAVDIRRELAKERPDAFNSDFATSLGALGVTFARFGEFAEALRAFAVGVRVLWPYFEAQPQAHGRVFSGLLSDVVRVRDNVGLEIPEDLRELVAKFEAQSLG